MATDLVVGVEGRGSGTGVLGPTVPDVPDGGGVRHRGVVSEGALRGVRTFYSWSLGPGPVVGST